MADPDQDKMDKVLERMLKTPPKPHKKKGGNGDGKEKRRPQ
ncbi:hypothetical protein [Parasphingopyxis sp.]|nr:hypothetical protein [Parasphingopyxis sp.]